MSRDDMMPEDHALEDKIDNAFMRLQFASTRRQRCQAADELGRLVNQRSARRVAQMEKEQGLCRRTEDI